MNVKNAGEDPEIEFQVESVEKDVSAGAEKRVAEHRKAYHLETQQQTVKNLKLVGPHLMFQFLKLSLHLQQELN